MKAPGGAILISLSLEGEGQACHESEPPTTRYPRARGKRREWFMGGGGYTRFRTDPVERAIIVPPKMGGVWINAGDLLHGCQQGAPRSLTRSLSGSPKPPSVSPQTSGKSSTPARPKASPSTA